MADGGLSQEEMAMLAEYEAMNFQEDEETQEGSGREETTTWRPAPTNPDSNTSLTSTNPPMPSNTIQPSNITTVTPEFPIQTLIPLAQRPRFYNLPDELVVKIWKLTSWNEVTNNKTVRFDQPPSSKSFPLMGTTMLSRQICQRICQHFCTVLTHPGIQGGPPFDVYVKYDTDIIHLTDPNGEHPIDRAVSLYPTWITSVQQIAINPQNIPQTEYVTGQFMSVLWSKVTQAFPQLRKVIIFDFEGARNSDPDVVQPPIGGTSFKQYFFYSAYTTESLAGRLFGIELEQKVFLED